MSDPTDEQVEWARKIVKAGPPPLGFLAGGRLDLQKRHDMHRVDYDRAKRILADAGAREKGAADG